MSVRVEHGDCLKVMAQLAADGVQVDSVVTDPPYHLTSIVQRFGKTSCGDDTKTSERSRQGADGYARLSTGFMGQKWDGGDVAFRPETWRLVLDVLKPGGHAVIFGGTRTYHRLACAIEDAGFEIRDAIMWHYGSGFPKSHSVSKAIDRAAGAERETVRTDKNFGRSRLDDGKTTYGDYAGEWDITAPATDAAKQWDGWGTALKPATEIICLARKPLSEKTVAANVLKHGTGALNIDGCRVGTAENLNGGAYAKTGGRRDLPGADRSDTAAGMMAAGKTAGSDFEQPTGRWPANCIHDGSEEVMEAFARAGERPSCMSPSKANPEGRILGGRRSQGNLPMDSGTAARFFYCSKADKSDRLQSKHPTVKPVDLIAYLCRLITPPGGTVLDPFAGSGTTGMACLREGFDAILIEKEARFVADIERRLAHVEGADTPLFQGAPA